MWLGQRGSTTRITSVVLLEGIGVTEEPSFFEVSPTVFGRVGAWASERNEALLAVAHSHSGKAATWMSPTDRRGAVRVLDLLTIVVPGFGQVADPLRWGFYRYADGTFIELSFRAKSDTLIWSDEPITLVRADEDGVVDV
jgi:hypothetical protein